jgi:hypothetical protein
MKTTLRVLVILSLFISLFTARPARAANTTYYVSMSGGSDANDGLTTLTPFKTIAKVNALNLQPGDRVLFKCGDVWRGEMLRVEESGTAGSPITFSSYPANTCDDKPVISGAQPISGWSPSGTSNIYVATLSAVTFPHGINQLFRNGQRLGIGRWPNITAPDGGYSTIDAQPGGTQFTDNQLPAVDWSGATAHIKGMRWYILNRTITGDSGNTLTVNANLDCWGGCTG